jgi:hypothetical protein
VPLDTLLESIGNVGVLVPVTIYPKIETATNPKKDQFVLLDGERRWTCVKRLHRRLIPAIIVEKPTDVSNILIMFHIHNLRLGWQLMPTALKLQALMETLGETNERKLSELTKLTVSQVRRCKILLSYPKRFWNTMLAPPSLRLKPDFFIELQRIRGPALEHRFPWWVGRGDARSVDIMLEKYRDEKIEAVTDFRTLAQIYRACVDAGKTQLFHAEMEKFMADKNYRLDDVDIPGASFESKYKEVLRSARRLLTQVKELPPDAISADNRVVRVLRMLRDLIESKLERALLEEAPTVVRTK